MKRIFPDREFSEAAGILELISKSPEQQMRYNARLKFQLDEAVKLEQARLEGEVRGEAKGVKKGVLLGRIELLQELLGVSLPVPEELSNCDEGQLSEIAEQLQSQLRNRGH